MAYLCRDQWHKTQPKRIPQDLDLLLTIICFSQTSVRKFIDDLMLTTITIHFVVDVMRIEKASI